MVLGDKIMKLNRKGKTAFAIALSACMAGMAFSALPLLSVRAEEAKLHCTDNGTCDENGFNEAGPCKTYSYQADENTTWTELEEAAKRIDCTGWAFAGWYTAPLEYHYWGGRENVFGTEDKVLYPEEAWKSALNFAEYYKANGNKPTDANIVNGQQCETKYYYKELFGSWLVKFKDAPEMKTAEVSEEEDKKIVESTLKAIEEKSVTEDNLKEKITSDTTLYARMKPQTVQVKFLSKKPDSQKAKEDPNRPGRHYGDVSQYIRIYRPYGTPLGELFQEIGDMQFGRKLIGWRIEEHEETLTHEDGIWTQRNINYWWCSTVLNEDFLESKPNSKDLNTKYDWSLNLYAVYESEDVNSQAEQEKVKREQEKQAMEQESESKSDASDDIEEKHVCGNGVLVVKEATCEATGIRAHFKCSCGLLYWNQTCTNPVEDKEELISAKHHNMLYAKEEAATCTEDGKAERWYCTTCHKFFSDEKGEQTLEDITIKAHHDYETLSDGTKRCKVCGDKDESEKVVETKEESVAPQVDRSPKKQAKKAASVKPAEKPAEPEEKQETVSPATEPVKPAEEPVESKEKEEETVPAEREQQTRPEHKKGPKLILP